MESKEVKILHRVKDGLQTVPRRANIEQINIELERIIKFYAPRVLYGALYLATSLTGFGSIGFSSNVTSLDRELSTPPVSLDAISRLKSPDTRELLMNYRKRLSDQRDVSEAMAATLMLLCFGGCLKISSIDFGKK